LRAKAVDPSAGAFLALFLPGILIKPLILLMFMPHHHSEKQRDNSGKTANYQRYSATMFFHAHLGRCSYFVLTDPAFKGAAGKILRRRVRDGKGGLARPGVHIGMRDGAPEKQC